MMSYGLFYPMTMTVYLIGKLSAEEGIGSGTAIGSYVVGWPENLTVAILLGFQYRVMQYRDHFVFLTNQLFRYSQKIEANATCLIVMIGICNFTLAHICIKSLTPISVEQRVTRRQKDGQQSKCMIEYVVTTENFGDMDDSTMLDMYRIQQLFNKILNELDGSIVIAFNHIICLIVFVFFTFTAIRYSDDVFNTGIIVIVAIFSAIFATLIAEWYEAVVSGYLYDVSNDFVGKVRRITSRKSGAHKRVLGCPCLAFDIAHPFFMVDKHTFLQFVHQGLDFLTTLLLM
ncbi:unnamed protein product [Orchesella dallaii]|uniref:Uncharacterized protein n=1 Tax=Orchesella dallaii TaxID=48710 RepID=A0ABP1PR07_9HEXA